MPPPSVLCLTLAGVPWDAGVSFSEVAAGGWPCPRGPGAAVDRARWEGWGGARMGGCSWWEQQLPPLTSTGGQCNIKVPPDCSARTPCRGPWVQRSGSASYVWNCWWAGTRPGGLGMHSHLRISFVCCLFCFDFRVSEGAY